MSREFILPAVPLVAILRGLTPERALSVGQALYLAGFRLLEVPLNRPGALAAMETLVRHLPGDALIGAGTVLDEDQVAAVAQAGGKLIISPDCNPAVIAKSRALGLFSIPGAATPTEAFTAWRAGAHAIKAFPAEAISPESIKAWRTVLPVELPILPVGGITPDRLKPYRLAGADGFGLGGALFQPDIPLDELAERAKVFVETWRNLTR